MTPRPSNQYRSSRPQLGIVEQVLMRFPHIHNALDAGALQSLQSADPERAVEVIQDIAAKGDVRNPSAFAVKSLTAFPLKRGNANSIDVVLKRHPGIHAALDDAAVSRLQGADPARAIEIIEDVAARPNIQNMSAFVVKALREHPQKRSGNEYMTPTSTPHTFKRL